MQWELVPEGDAIGDCFARHEVNLLELARRPLDPPVGDDDADDFIADDDFDRSVRPPTPVAIALLPCNVDAASVVDGGVSGSMVDDALDGGLLEPKQ